MLLPTLTLPLQLNPNSAPAPPMTLNDELPMTLNVATHPTHTNNDQPEALAHKPTPKKPFTDDDFILKPDVILVPVARKTINPDFIRVTKMIDFTNINEAANLNDQLTDQHKEVCTKLNKDYYEAPLFVHKLPGQTFTKGEVILHCTAAGMTPPRPHANTESLALIALMKKNHLERVVTDLQFPSKEKSTSLYLTYGDGTTPFTTYDNYERYKDTYKPGQHDENTLTYFERTDQSTNILFGHIDKDQDTEKFPLVCQARPLTADLRAEVDFCRARSSDMQMSGMIMHNAIKLVESTKPLDNPLPGHNSSGKFDALPTDDSHKFTNTTASRNRRAVTVLGGLAAVSLLAATANSLITSAKSSVNANNIAKNAAALDALKINIEDIKTENRRFMSDTRDALNNIQDVQALVTHETRIFAAALNLKSSLADNVIVFDGILNNILYGRYSPLILSPEEIHQLQETMADKTAQHLSLKIMDYEIKPTLVNGQLAVDITIPLIDKTREATIFQIINIPTFQDGLKLTLDCDHEYVALYESSNSYNTLSKEEIATCLNEHSHCNAASPRFDNAIDNCAARQFHSDSPKNTYKQVSDLTPFLHTRSQVTVYSVPTVTLVDFQCPDIDRPGADLRFNISNRGYFVNPQEDCTFATSYASYSPPTERHAVAGYIQELFTQALDPRNYNFPKQRKFDIPEYIGSNEAAQTAAATTVTYVFPVVIAVLLAVTGLSGLYAFFFMKAKGSKNRLKDKINGIRDFLGHNTDDDKGDLEQAQRMGLRAAGQEERRPILINRNREPGPVRPARRTRPYGPEPRPKNYQDPFEVHTHFPIYPDIVRADSDPPVVATTNGVYHPANEHHAFYTLRANEDARRENHQLPPDMECELLNNAARFATFFEKEGHIKRPQSPGPHNESAQEPMDTSL